MAQLNLNVTLTWQSNKTYTFQLYDFMPFSTPGSVIYIVGKLTDGWRMHTTLYVGQTEDISTRFRNHHKDQEFRNHGANCIGLFYVHNQQDRDWIEKDLIPKYNPVCNEQLTR